MSCRAHSFLNRSAVEGDFADQGGHSRIVGVRATHRAQLAGRGGGGLFPVLVQLPFPRVEEGGEQLRAAYAVHPVAAVQSECSLWTRDPETMVADAARELGIGLVAYSPLGRGFLTGTVEAGALAAGDGWRRPARFAEGAAAANRSIVQEAARIAAAKGATAGQVALAWVAAQAPRLGVPVVPIPGTKRVR